VLAEAKEERRPGPCFWRRWRQGERDIKAKEERRPGPCFWRRWRQGERDIKDKPGMGTYPHVRDCCTVVILVL
jgi:hypothetical protein